MKKTITLISLFILICSVFVLAGCSKEAAEDETVQPPEVPFEEPEQDSQSEVPEFLISDVSCVNQKIQGTISNIGDEIMDLSMGRAFINGIPNNVLECDEMVLEPGESTFCANLIGRATALTTRVNSFDLRVGEFQQVEMVSCE